MKLFRKIDVSTGNFLEDMMHLFLSFIGNGYNRFEFTCLISTHIRLWCP